MGRRGLRMTMATLQVLRLFLEDTTAKRYGLDIGRATGLPSGTVYETLMRLEQEGFLSSAWEDVDPTVVGRPRRRFYQLTAEGVPSARVALAEAQQTLASRRGDRGLFNPKEGPAWKYSLGYLRPLDR